MIQKFFFFLVLLILIPDSYIYKLFISKMEISPLMKGLFFLPSVFLLIAFIYLAFFAGATLFTEHGWCIGGLVIFYLLISLPKLFFMLFSLFDLPLNYFFKVSVMPFSYLGGIAALLCAGVIIYGAVWGKTKFDVRQETFYSSKLPQAFDNYKVVQISDLHIGSWEGNKRALQQAVELINRQKADLVVFTGDLVNHRANELDEFEEILGSIEARDGIFSILGNHDYGPYYPWKSKNEQAENLVELKQKEANMGWTLLNNENRFLHRGNDSIALIGVENQGEPPFSQHGDLRKAIQGTEQVAFKLLLSHNPTHWRSEVLSTDIPLTLSGHTHAMQLALGRFSFSSLVYPEWKGMYMENGQSLYVNIGLGFVGIPFRFGAWPEITVFTLKKRQD